MHVDWQNYLRIGKPPPALQPYMPPERLPTWVGNDEYLSSSPRWAQQAPAETAAPVATATSTADFLVRLDEQEYALQRLQLGDSEYVRAGLVDAKRGVALATAAEKESRRLAHVEHAVAHSLRGTDIVPCLDRHRPEKPPLSSREIESQRPYHRRVAREVAGNEVVPTALTPRLYKKHRDYRARRAYTHMDTLDPRKFVANGVTDVGYTEAPYPGTAPKWLRGERGGPGGKSKS